MGLMGKPGSDSPTGIEDVGGWSKILQKLVAGDQLGNGEAAGAMGSILKGEATHAQVAAFLTALKVKGETIEEIRELVATMLAFAEPLTFDEPVIDTCGTGGDGIGTINVSTVAAFIVAGAGGKVVKHGNRAQSSRVGSADLLEAMGVVIDLGPQGVRECADKAGIGFCLAPRFHPSMKHVGPVRRELGFPTIFNFLGPLAHPSRAPFRTIGVSNPEMAHKIAHVLPSTGIIRAAVVFGDDGMDEVTTTAPSTLLMVSTGASSSGGRASSGHVTETRIDPEELGIPRAKVSELLGGGIEENLSAAHSVLGSAAGPLRDICVVNAALSLVVSGIAEDLKDGISRAEESLDSGSAKAAMDRLVAVSNEAGRAGL